MFMRLLPSLGIDNFAPVFPFCWSDFGAYCVLMFRLCGVGMW